jgi:S-DNA-T family DNA segregation ATPase FtsK/SpoIIIE
MKPQRLVLAPTRSRRLNEMLGLVVLVAAVLLLLSFVTYNPADPSLNTVGGGAGVRPAHNWAGLVGAYLSDILLQILGVAVLLAPVVMGRVGIAWLRSRPVGSTAVKASGLLMWLVFAPAAIALLPGQFLWRGAVPISGVEGRVLADLMIEFVNFPGALPDDELPAGDRTGVVRRALRLLPPHARTLSRTERAPCNAGSQPCGQREDR